MRIALIPIDLDIRELDGIYHAILRQLSGSYPPTFLVYFVPHQFLPILVPKTLIPGSIKSDPRTKKT